MSSDTSAPPAGRPLPPADATFSIQDIVRRGGTSLRTVRHYVAQKVLVPPAFRSSKTRYDRAFLVRFQAARALRLRGEHLPDIRAKLDAMAFAEMARLAGYTVDAATEQALSAAARTSLPGGSHAVSPHAVSPHAVPTTGPVAAGAGAGAQSGASLPGGFVGAYRAGPAVPSERWEHFDVCPGVRLLVRTEADAEAWRVAREMLALFAAPPPR